MSNKTIEEGVSETTSGNTNSRPSLAQVRAIVSYLEKHPELGNKKQRLNANTKYKKLWLELTNNLNQLNGAQKSLKGWIKFWSDKKRFTQAKKKHIDEGRMTSALTLLEHKILDLCETKLMKKKKPVKQEPYNGDDSFDQNDLFVTSAQSDSVKELVSDRLASTESEHKQLTMIEKMVGVMDEQASALTQMAQASLTNSKALERIAEASHVQALAVERLVGTFETISASAHDIRNAVIGIDYTLKRCYPAQQRQNTTLFT